MIKRLFNILADKNHGSSKDSQLLSSLKNITGFVPNNLSLYKQALRHKSAAIEWKNITKISNERLEFLGDAILSAVIADLLFRKYPLKDEGFLTELRSKLVSRDHLNKLSIKLGLPQFIERSNENGNRSKSMNGDALEALIGAIYLDKGYKKTYHFLATRLFTHVVDIEEVENTEVNFKSKLIEWSQKEKHIVSFEIISEEMHRNQRMLKVQVSLDGFPLGSGLDFSKKKAEQIAAFESLKLIEALF